MKNLTLKQLNKMFQKTHSEGFIYKEKAGKYAVVYTPGGKVYSYTVDSLYRLAEKLELMTWDQIKEYRGY